MALVFKGISGCPLCGKVISRDDDIVGLPAISDKEHYLYSYFDCGFHKLCFDNWDKKEEVFKIIADEKEKFENAEYYKQMALKYGKPGKEP